MKTKTCSFCGQETTKLFYANPKCCTRSECLMKYKNQKHEKTKSKSGARAGETKPRQLIGKTRNNTINKKPRKTTGELKLFLKIYSERNATCQVTGQHLSFDIRCFSHILSKGAYPGYRLNPDNIIMVTPEIHDLYDNSNKEKLLEKYPEAKVIFEKKEELRYRYYN